MYFLINTGDMPNFCKYVVVLSYLLKGYLYTYIQVVDGQLGAI